MTGMSSPISRSQGNGVALNDRFGVAADGKRECLNALVRKGNGTIKTPVSCLTGNKPVQA